ncbi:hypothetical protein DFP93_10849 [Aneurinibacillus soli]|uniref:Flagellar hook-length control protein FliK n=1 Tax=Aneurinibacillus soli TaxID=1500254 RepID=A0A0U4WCP0_9BACL|nr:hypothetical protein [Aneurinibacillus soli]PYE61476.1 hypothetical protein DFP93_10849 [Aneurinibacillus soli]BAU26569.1 Flagellar hook-length control protein FliK [Aneurinibacillus soli]
MQISDFQPRANQSRVAGTPAELSVGQSVMASVKQKVSMGEAVIEVNGQEYRAVFEKEAPAEGKVQVQITGRNAGMLQVRTTGDPAETLPVEEPSVEKVLQQAGVKATPEMKELVQRFAQQQIPATKEMLQFAQRIIQKGEGTVSQKLDTLVAMAQKEIHFTSKSYDAVFRVLHGPSLDKILTQLAKEAPDLIPKVSALQTATRTVSQASVSVPEARQQVQPEPAAQVSRNLDVLKQAMERGVPLSKEAVQKLVSQLREGADKASLPVEARRAVEQVVKQVEQAIRETPTTEKAVAPQTIARTVDRGAIEQAVRQVASARTSQTVEPSVQVDQTMKTTPKEETRVQSEPAAQVSRNLDVLKQAVERGVPLSKEVVQKLVSQLREGAEKASLPVEARRAVEQVVKQVEQAIRETPATEKVIAPQTIARTVDRGAIEQAVRQIASIRTAPTKEPSVQADQTMKTMPREEVRVQSEPAAQISRNLDVLKQAVERGVPLSKEAVQKLVSQLREGADKASLPVEVRRAVEQVVKQVEQAIRETPVTEKVIAPQTIARTVDRGAIGQAVRQIASTRTAPTKEPSVQADQTMKTMPREEARVQPEPAAQISRNLEVLKQAVERGVPLSKEAVQKLVTQLREGAEKASLPVEVRRAVEQVVKQVEQAIRETPATEKAIATQTIARTVDRGAIEQAVRQVASARTAPTVEADVQSASAIRTASAGETQSPTKADEAIQKLANLVIDIRTAGKITRSQIEALQKSVADVTEAAGIRPELAKDIKDLLTRLSKDLRMSMSYEAVGRSTEAKAMVDRSLDTVVKMFKLPVTEVLATRQQSTDMGADVVGKDGTDPAFLRPMSDTLLKLGSIISLARQELQGALGAMDTSDANGWRDPGKIVADMAGAIRTAATREGLSRDDVKQIEQILTQAEQAVSKPQLDKDALVHDVKELEQFLTNSGERLAALTAVQTANFERVTQYIPDRLREVGEEFKQVKKEITNNVERVIQFLQQKIPQAPSYVQRIVEPTIEMVNRLVTKGEFALFADMEFEHQVLRISGDLNQVKGLLDKGKQDEALQIFHRVRGELDKLNWQPAYTKVERFFSKMTSDGDMQNPLQTYGQQWRDESLSGRGVQEMMRGMGLNHERDAIDWMARREGHMSMGQDGSNQQDRPPHNLKSMLMDGMEGNVSPRAREMMEHALSNLTGQQLLSKQDSGMPMQTMQVQIPLPWEEGQQTVQMQIQSRTNGEQMDWQNCNLFFFLDTPKFGEMGVSVTVVDRDMSVRVQNDLPNIEQVFTPYIPQLKQELQNMGYHVNGVTFTPVAQPASEISEQAAVPTVDVAVARKAAMAYNSREGLDFSV